MTPVLRRQAERAVQVITNQSRQISADRSVLFILEEIGWHPRLARLGQHRPFVWAVEWGYWIVTKNRAFFARFMFPAID